MESYNGDNNYYPQKIGKISFSDCSDNDNDNDDADWKDYRKIIMESRSKSQDDFEKYLNIFSSGGLLIGLTLLSKLTETELTYKYQYLVILGTVLFLASIMANVFSHYIAIANDDCTIAEIDCKNQEIIKNIDRRDIVVIWLNRISMFSISVATILILTFLIINL